MAANGTIGLLDTVWTGGNPVTHMGGDLITEFWELNGSLVPSQLTSEHPQLQLSDYANGLGFTRRQPYIGDYEGLVAAGDNFYGTFSAYNDPTEPDITFPDPTHVIFQRNVVVDGHSMQFVDLKNPGGVIDGLVAVPCAEDPAPCSIDPYFFSVVRELVPEPATWLLFAAGLAGLLGLARRPAPGFRPSRRLDRASAKL